jgi:FtsZ-interacting cell division protein ZipA
MSLRDWSSPYNEQNVVSTRAAARKKVSLAQLNQVEEEGALADFQPMRPEPSEKRDETRKEPEKEEEKEKEKEVIEWDPYPSLVPVEQTDLSKQVAYMIQLLEEQRDEKTGHVTEEIILYLFLGIFVIFVVDTFVKTGRYSR